MAAATVSIPASVKTVFDGYPSKARKQMMGIRKLIYKLAAENPAIGQIEETLKWSEPAYLTSETGAGSTVRIAWKEKAPDKIAVYLNCQTSLVDTYRTVYPELQYEGNRAIVMSIDEPLPEALSGCLEMALTYHLSKRRRA